MRSVKFGKNRWCGPAAISIIIGCDTDVAAAAIRHSRGMKMVKGTHVGDVTNTLRDVWGCEVARRYDVKRIDDMRNWMGTYLVATVDHWMVVSGGKVCCNHLGKPISITNPNAPQYAKVESCYWVGPPTRKWGVPKVKRSKYGKTWCQREIARHDWLELDILNESCFGVFPNGLEDDKDPYWDDHYVHSWEEVAERIQTYADLDGVWTNWKAAARELKARHPNAEVRLNGTEAQ